MSNLIITTTPVEHIVIGAGPAGICAVAELLAHTRNPRSIVWIDPEFKVGEFGTSLSIGSSVPGNTAVESYQKVINSIYQLHPNARPKQEKEKTFRISHLAPDCTCSLQIAAEPMQHISDYLRTQVQCIVGRANNIDYCSNQLSVNFTTIDGVNGTLNGENVVLAIGAEAKTLPTKLKKINPNTAFIESELKNFLKNNPEIKKVIVVGSSHSAALAVMHLLKAGVHVKQIMNKVYLFAENYIDTNGCKRIKFDNIGLKGEVATFTKKLLQDKQNKISGYADHWEVKMHQPIDTLKLDDYQHTVICIGYEPKPSLTINQQHLNQVNYDVKTGQLRSKNANNINGLFGFGIAYPFETIAPTGEKEFSVGIGKFWSALQNGCANRWTTKSHRPAIDSNNHSKLFSTKKNDAHLFEKKTPKQLRSKL